MEKDIIICKTCGLCYGSKRAIDKTKELLNSHDNVVLYKEILHNKNVMKNLLEQGATLKNTLAEINSNDYVIVRAHGEPEATFNHFEKNNIKYLDCTCPNVKSINLLVKEKDKNGYKIIIIGKHGFDGKPIHPEVLATAGWCTSPILIEDECEIEKIDMSYEKYYLVMQTTFSASKALSFVEKIKEKLLSNNKIFEYRNTLCSAQRNINKDSLALANIVDVMIVIGGKSSSNTKELYNNITAAKETYLIDDPQKVLDLLKENKIKKEQTIGLTAGASTMKEDIIKVKQLIENQLN